MVSITLSANGKTYTIHPLGTNELCALEDRLGKNFGTLMSEIGAFGMEGMRLATVRLFLLECLAEAEDMDEQAIGDLIDAIGFDGVSAAVNGLVWPAREIGPSTSTPTKVEAPANA